MFSLFGIAAALEVLRHANRFAGKTIYRWSFLCEQNQPVQDSNGLFLQPSTSIQQAEDSDIAFMVAAFDANDIEAPQLLQWLSRQANAGRYIGGISNGAFQLAKGNLLDGYNATCHWEDFESFFLTYPQVHARYQRFVFDRNRITCSGGTATLDLFIEIVRNDHNSELALKVARQMLLRDHTETGDDQQQYSTRVQRALNLFDVSIEHGLNIEQLASRVGVSRRELLRLFQRETGKTPSDLLNQRRLRRAHALVTRSQLSIASISAALGFSSQSHLTTAYRKYYATTPAQHRRQQQPGTLKHK